MMAGRQRPTHRRHWVRVLVWVIPPTLLGLGLAGACGGPRVVTPDEVEHPLVVGEGTCVPYPPPAAKPEELPPRPAKQVWIDGEWEWETHRWVWHPGGWVAPPPHGAFSPWRLERISNGALVHYPGHWFTKGDIAHFAGLLEAGIEAGDDNATAQCPAPPRTGPSGPILVRDGAPNGDTQVHVGAALLFVADAPSAAPPQIVDAILPPPETSGDRPLLIAPPD